MSTEELHKKKNKIDWNYWRKVVAEKRPDLTEDFEESNGAWVGWQYKYGALYGMPWSYNAFMKFRQRYLRKVVEPDSNYKK